MNRLNGAPTLSVITVCRNSQATIGETLHSVAGQTYKNVEHIIIDGLSTDATLEIIGNTVPHVQRILSEKDNGIYDAMNKGLALARGDIVGILNSDDRYVDNDVLGKVAQAFSALDIDAVWGNIHFVSARDSGKIVRSWRSSPFTPGAFAEGWHPPHPSFFVKKSVYESCGYFDTRFKVSADFELMLRFLEKNRIKGYHLDEFLVNMRMGGASTGSIRNIITGNLNILRAFKKNGIPVTPLYPFKRLVPKLRQFLIKGSDE
ncbi:MAG TPA: glycosyltransferase [Desulfuromonadales bacterium]|nr:glycosyltransferase [Desulfuromonadales bacterium]